MSMIVNPYRYGGGGGGASFVPTDLASLAGWWDADQQSEADGATVATWTDQSGNGFPYSQVGGSVPPPVIRHNFVNGKKALEAGGALSDRHLRASSSLMNGATAGTMMMVVKVYADPTTSPEDFAAVQKFSTASSNVCHFFTDGKIYENFGSTTRRDVNPTPSMASWRMYGVHSGTNDWSMWLDGTAILTSGTNTVNFGSAGRDLFYIVGGGGRFRGHLAELVICDAVLSTSDRQKLEGYYAHKYALTANLPGGHPYISSPP